MSNGSALNVHIGARLRAARREANLSEMELAARLGVDTATLAMYEDGSAALPAPALAEAAKVVQRPFEYFFDGYAGSANRIDVETTTSPAVSDGLALLRMFSEIRDPGERKTILAFVKAFVDRNR